MTTIVSCFYSNVNQRTEKTFHDYLNYGILLLKATIPKIIFTDELMYEKIHSYENEHTKIILSKKEDIYLYNYRDKLDNFNINSTNSLKDTLEYMLIICNKTEVMRQAIELNYFHTDYFTWLDFGLKCVVHCDEKEYINKVESLTSRTYDKIRMATIWNVDLQYQVDIFRRVAWFFAGGVFGGNKDSLLVFADKTKEMCIHTIENQHTIMWEVNIWYLVYLQNKELFDCYYCDHNNSIIDNY